VSRAAAVVIGVALAGCGSFEDGAIVIDLRAIAMVATPPEQVFAIDPANPTAITPDEVQVCGLVADPEHRDLEWRMIACPLQRDLRCTDLEAPFVVVDAVEERNDLGLVGQLGCATIPGGGPLTDIVRYTLENDALQGFGGVDINVSLRVAPVGATDDEAVFAGKSVRFSAKLPAERVANRNPVISEILVQVDRGQGFDEPLTLGTGGCLGPSGRLAVSPGDVVKFAPRAVDGSVESYVVPTFEGGSRTFTETLSYQWLATAGSWSRDRTGGPRDNAGNPAAVSTEWRAPDVPDGADVRLVDLWVLQHDERGGADFVESCIVVTR